MIRGKKRTKRNFKERIARSSLVAQWVKNLAMSQQQLRWLLWHGFNPWPCCWPRSFHMLPAQPKKKKEQKGMATITIKA